MTTPALTLTATHVDSTTYSFRTTGGWPWPSWALCTVNDRTGEILITSDWGSWCHRWNIDAIGYPTLTAFIGTRTDVDYLARKLQVDEGRRFSARETAAALRRALCEQRLEHGRSQIERRLPLLRARKHYLTRDRAREIWIAIDRVADVHTGTGDSSDLFYERISSIDGFTAYVTEEPWIYGETEPTPEDRALRDIVLPALIEACRAETGRREIAAWFTCGPQPAAEERS